MIRIFLFVLVGLIGGFLFGIGLSSMIGSIGLLFFDQPIGIKYLPYYFAIFCAIVIPIIDYKRNEQ